MQIAGRLRLIKKFALYCCLPLVCTAVKAAESTSTESAISALTSESINYDIPKGYKHRPPSEQIQVYREIFDGEIQKYGSPEATIDKNIKGLFDILKNGFALVNDTIQGRYPEFKRTKDISVEYQALMNEWQSIRNRNDQQIYLTKLQELWSKAKKFEDGLTIETFQRFLYDLAIIIDAYKSGINYDERNKNTIWMDPFTLPRVVFVIFGNPNPISNRNLNAHHFVTQFCEGDYVAYISFFDSLSNVREGSSRSKKDPHWSLYNGTFKMLRHDLAHNYDQDATYGFRQNEFDINKPKIKNNLMKICKIRDLYQKEGNINAVKIITNALFIKLHEMPRDISSYCTDTLSKCISSGQKLNKLMQENVDEKYENEESIQYYKRFYRDNEFILKSRIAQDADFLVDGKDVPLFNFNPRQSEITKDQKRILKVAALKDGYNRFWNYYVELCFNKLDIIEKIEPQPVRNNLTKRQRAVLS